MTAHVAGENDDYSKWDGVNQPQAFGPSVSDLFHDYACFAIIIFQIPAEHV